MNAHPFPSRARSGFTLVEMIAAVAVLSLMLLALAATLNSVTALWSTGAGTLDNFTKARTMLNSMDRDIQMMVLRRDTAAFVDSSGNPAFAFYSNVEADESPAESTNDTRTLSLVQFLLTTTTTSSVLQRLSYGANFATQTNGPLATSTNSNVTTNNLMSGISYDSINNTNLSQENLASGVIAFQWQFVDGTGNVLTPPYIPTGSASGTTPFSFSWPNTTTNPRAVIVSLVVLSNSAYTLAIDSGTLATVVADFPTSTSSPAASLTTGQTYSAYWNSLIDNGTTLSNLPAPIRAGIQVFQRTIPLPVVTPSS